MSEPYLIPGEKAHSQVNRRSKIETYCEIVKAVGTGAQRPTHIMYKANLSWSVMQEYISYLESSDILTSAVVDGKRMFHLTEKGFGLLNKYLALREDLSFNEDQTQRITVPARFSY